MDWFWEHYILSHFAELGADNVVLRVIVGPAGMTDADGLQWVINALGGVWVQTSYNATIRKNYAGIGYTYDAGRDAFIPPKPYPSWSLSEQTCRYAPPKPMPIDGVDRRWDETKGDWVLPALVVNALP